MRISTIAWANLRRRKGRAALLVAGVAIGIATAVALLTLSRSISEEIGLQLDQYGANIVVVPKSDQLALDYGGVSVGTAAFDVGELTDEDARRIREIPYTNRLAVVAPKLLGAAEAEGRKVVVAGVDFESEYALKRWWRVVGEKPSREGELLIEHVTEDASLPVVPTSPNTFDASARGTMSAAEHAAHTEQAEQHFRVTRD